MEVVLRLLLAYVFCWALVPLGVIVVFFSPSIGAFLGAIASYELARYVAG